MADPQRVLRVRAAFDPNQPRDEEGQWTDSGGSIGSLVVEKTSSKYEKSRGLGWRVKSKDGVSFGYFRDLPSAKEYAKKIHKANPDAGSGPRLRKGREHEVGREKPFLSSVTVLGSFRFGVTAAAGTRKFRVAVLAAGFGANVEDGLRWFVPNTDDGLGSARRTFAGAKVHWHKIGDRFDHVEGALAQWLDAEHEAGYLSDLALVDGRLEATLHLHDDVPDEIVEVLASGKVGLSIEAYADRRPAIRDGVAVVELVNFRHGEDAPASVAIVSDPALHGEILRVAASRTAAAKHGEDDMPADMTREECKAVLADPDASDEMKAKARKRMKEMDDMAASTTVIEDATIKAARERAEAAAQEMEAAAKAVKVSAARIALNEALTASKLPEDACELIRDGFAAQIEAGTAIPAADVAKKVETARKLLAASDTRGGAGADIVVGAGAREKMALCLERLLLGASNAPKYAQERFAQLFRDRKTGKTYGGKLLASREQEAGIGYSDRPTSFKRTWREFMGFDIEDLWVHDSDRLGRLRASVNIAQWGDVFENVLNILGLAYQESPEYGAWRRIVRIVPISSIKKQERVVVGGYANLPTVAEGANYTAATSPGDHGHGYTPAKYGFTEDWTREAIIEDRIDALGSIIQKMALAADRTKHDHVFDQLTVANDPTMDYDSVALFHASSHGANLLTSALSATSLAAARLTMMKQTDLANSKRMNLRPAFLLVRMDEEETAWNLLKAKSEEPAGLTAERAWLRYLNLEIIVVRPTTNGWSTVADWVIAADPNNGLVPTFEMGFLGGREQAEIFVQDSPTVGSVFERDAITVAVKQPHFGGSPIRHEGFVLNDV